MERVGSVWSQKVSEVLKQLKTSEKRGLSKLEAKKRTWRFGKNEITHKRRTGALVILIRQFANWLVIVLFLAALVSYYLGERVDTMVIIGILFLSSMLGFIQEFKAEKTAESLKKYITKKAKVLRDGKWGEIKTARLVPGDIVRLRVGDLVPADMRLIETDGLSMNEAILTGESAPAEKDTEIVAVEKRLPYEQKNMVFKGTFVESGLGTGVVTAIGEETIFGKTAKGLEEIEPESEFQKQLAHFSRYLFWVIMAMTGFIFLANALLNKGVFDSFLFAVALAVGITPELLPMIVTVALSKGALGLAKNNVIVKKLAAVEDLGNIDVLCTDKTGTLTEGKFALTGYVNLDGIVDESILTEALVCSSAFTADGKTWANQMDEALWKSNALSKVKKKLKSFKLVDENEFDFKLRRMSVVAKSSGKLRLITKGAPETILDVCSFYASEGKLKKMTRLKKKKLLGQIDTLEESGFKVLYLADKKTKQKDTNIADEHGLTLRGMLTFKDPLKRSVAESLKILKQMGVKIKIISGDSMEIVIDAAVRSELVEEGEKVILGDKLEKMSDEEVRTVADKHTLFARITPDLKEKIVASLNHKGHVVAFLGDGVNDSPAIKAADVGIAVDSGAEITKDAADIVLLKKDLAVLAQGINSGRKTFGNITKYILNTISSNFGNMFTVSASSLFLSFIPLLPTQILLNNFISDIPLLAIATDNVDEEFVRKPRRWNIPLIGKYMVRFGLLSSLFDLATILPLLFIWRVTPIDFRTAWFVESSLSELLVTFAFRTKRPFFKSRPSIWLVWLSIACCLIVAGLPWTHFGRTFFQFRPITWQIDIWIGVVVLAYFTTMELVKRGFFVELEKD